ncbi:MAG: RidA family protein [Oscillospiraceae bacterium]|nr:RidA family protein [Oscillospiraceae bacterium]
MQKVSTKSAPAAIGPYSQAVKSGNMVYTSGQIALKPETGEFLDGDVKAQAVQLLENLKAVLEAAGSGLEKVVKTTCYLKSIDDFSAFNEVYAEYFKHQPARSCIEAANLPRGALVEVDAIAEN